MNNKIAEQVAEFISTTFIFSEELTHDLSLTESGIIDSMGVISVVTYLEDTFNIEIEDEEINQKNFGTISGIASFVGSKC